MIPLVGGSAEETRALAEEMADTESYRIILGIAESYDRLAELAEQLIKRDQLLPITLTHSQEQHCSVFSAMSLWGSVAVDQNSACRSLFSTWPANLIAARAITNCYVASYKGRAHGLAE